MTDHGTGFRGIGNFEMLSKRYAFHGSRFLEILYNCMKRKDNYDH